MLQLSINIHNQSFECNKLLRYAQIYVLQGHIIYEQMHNTIALSQQWK